MPVETTVPAVPEAMLAYALERSLEALSTTRGTHFAHRRLIDYYDTSGEYVGATFANLSPYAPDLLTAVDLHAVTQMSVEVGAGATRRLLNDGPLRDAVMEALEAVPDDVTLEDDDPPYLAMAAFHVAVREAISAPRVRDKNAWVTTSKVCARKRPWLMPVRDNEVCGLLGLIPQTGRANMLLDYQVFAYLLRHPAVVKGLDDAIELAVEYGNDRPLVFDTAPLRLLDATLWTYATFRR